MSLWIWLLVATLVFTPKGSSPKSGRYDLRAVALLFCVIALIAQT